MDGREFYPGEDQTISGGIRCPERRSNPLDADSRRTNEPSLMAFARCVQEHPIAHIRTVDPPFQADSALSNCDAGGEYSPDRGDGGGGAREHMLPMHPSSAQTDGTKRPPPLLNHRRVDGATTNKLPGELSVAQHASDVEWW